MSRAEALAPFISTLDIPAYSRSIRHTVGKEHCQLRMDYAPVLPPAGPFLRNIHHGQIQHFQQAVIRREDRFCLGHFPELSVKILSCICGVNQCSNRLQIFKIDGKLCPIHHIGGLHKVLDGSPPICVYSCILHHIITEFYAIILRIV